MNKFFRGSFLVVALCSAVVLTSCDDEDPPLPDNLVNFQASAQGLSDSESEITVTITLDRAVETAGNLAISYVATGLSYGADFITDPVVNNDNKIIVPVAAGATSTSFKVTKTNTTGLQGDEKVVFTIESIPDGLVMGTRPAFTLSFSEIIATSSMMEINGGGPTAPNRVYIDLSANRQTAVERTKWDLAFASGIDEFRVYLNSTSKMLARAIDKTDITAVNASDTTGFAAQTDLAAIFSTIIAVPPGQDGPAWLAESTSWMDDPADLQKTAISDIKEVDAENFVYIINRGTHLDGSKSNWVKIKITRDGSNYKIQYGNISDVNVQTATITKNIDTNLTYFSFDTNGVVTVEPNQFDWDIAWTGLTNETSFGGPFVPYYFNDIIIENTSTVHTAEVLTSTVSYDAYAVANIANTEFSNGNQLNIGSKWRSLGQSGASIKEDRFYVIKDSVGNVYKIKFIALTTNNERGRPQIQFDLVQKGS